MSAVIEAHGLSKRYRLGEDARGYDTIREAVVRRLRPGRQGPSKDFWALRDVDLTVDDGELVGLIGRNGAGKSTLLRLVAHITEPTHGVVRTRGRVGTLLEIGTGFHPELTGRENIDLAGAILGMRRAEVRTRTPEIVDFAGIDAAFLDTPLKRYSSGMALRLAFAVAANLRSQIIVVDEVLAVGDAAFQERCIDAMRNVTEQGRTVLFVSHDLGAIARVCRRVVHLDAGRVVEDGPTRQVVAAYLAAIGATHGGSRELGTEAGPVVVVDVAVTSAAGGPPMRGEPVRIVVGLRLPHRVPQLDVAITLRAPSGQCVLDEALSDISPVVYPEEPGEYEVTLEVPAVLAAGRFVVGLWLGTPYEEFFADEILDFDVLPAVGDPVGDRLPRVLHTPVGWAVREV